MVCRIDQGRKLLGYLNALLCAKCHQRRRQQLLLAFHRTLLQSILHTWDHACHARCTLSHVLISLSVTSAARIW